MSHASFLTCSDLMATFGVCLSCVEASPWSLPSFSQSVLSVSVSVSKFFHFIRIPVILD